MIRVALCDDEVESFNIPSTTGTTLHVSFYLDRGSYEFYITPDGYSRTSG